MSEKPPSTVKEVAKALADLSDRLDKQQAGIKNEIIKVIETEIDYMRKGMDFINEKFEMFKTEIVEVRKELVEVKARNREIANENTRLLKDLREVKKDLVDLQQHSRKNNLEVKGIPVAPDENLASTMKTIAVCVGSEIQDSDIEVIHRVPTKDKAKQNIVVRFVSRKVETQGGIATTRRQQIQIREPVQAQEQNQVRQ
ncbi:hypothetical protein HPB49_008893 [Dermacentor silvarum]|uniref:Uncharacterized protein n=1 Tax=Dermacentor silvarum TaxID=543639 RepID=A0ACB8C2R3_DERSI|nr:hypothetical protein HPB49_008893 [Dermacentor silvarum]